MSLSDIYKNIEAHLMSEYKDADVFFAGRKVNNGTLIGNESYTLDCSLMPVAPFSSSLCKATRQFILDIRYISSAELSIPKTHEERVSGIIKSYNVGSNIGGISIYSPTAVSQWFLKESTREAVISIYFQIDEVI